MVESKSTRALGQSDDGILRACGRVYVRRLFGSGRSGMGSTATARSTRSIDQAYTAFLELNAELFCQAHGFPAAKPPPDPPGVTPAKDQAQG